MDLAVQAWADRKDWAEASPNDLNVAFSIYQQGAMFSSMRSSSKDRAPAWPTCFAAY